MTVVGHINLGRLDLKLLVAFEALFSERGAIRVGLGRPAISHDLACLQAIAGNELRALRHASNCACPRVQCRRARFPSSAQAAASQPASPAVPTFDTGPHPFREPATQPDQCAVVLNALVHTKRASLIGDARRLRVPRQCRRIFVIKGKVCSDGNESWCKHRLATELVLSAAAILGLDVPDDRTS